MNLARQAALMCLALVTPVLVAQIPAYSDPQHQSRQALPASAEQLFALGNQARAADGLGSLKWDKALSAGAMQHCLRMAKEGPISHRYGGEPDLTARASQAGAHFSLIAENIAVGPYAASIQQGWMNSPTHRANLLNPNVNRVGIAVVSRGGVLFAVADFARIESVMTQAQVESGFASMLRGKGLSIQRDSAQVRSYCASPGRTIATDPPDFAIRWQGPDLTQMPPDLATRVASGRYRSAAVGSCPAQGVEGGFTVYRVAVFLYGSNAAGLATR